MRNDRLIKKLLDSGLLSADPDTGAVYYKGRVRGYVKAGDKAGGEAGYLRFGIYQGRRRRMLQCHRVVMIASDGVPKFGMEVDHLPQEDGSIDKTDNRRASLEWVNGFTNVQRAHAAGCCGNWVRTKDPVTGRYIKDLEEAPF